MAKDLSSVTVAARRRLSRVGLAFFVFFLTVFALQFIVSVLVSLFAPQWAEAPIFLWLLSILPMYGVAFPLYYLVLKSLPTGEAGGRMMRRRDLCILFFIAFAVMYVTNLISVAINALTELILGTSSSAGATELMTSSPLYLTVIFAVILGPIVEEVMFRGILLPRLLPFGERFAILTSALLFGLFHGNFAQFFYAFAIGLIFGLVVCRTGRVRHTVTLHILLNFFGSIPATVLGRATERLDLENMDDAAILESPEAILTTLATAGYGMLLLAAVAIGLYLLVRYAKRMRPRPTECPIPRGEVRYLPLSVGGVLYFLMLIALFVFSYL